MLVGFIEQSVSSKVRTRSLHHCMTCMTCMTCTLHLVAVHPYGILMYDDFLWALLRCQAESRKTGVTGQVLQPDVIDGPGVPDDYWFETAETHRFQIAGPAGCQGFVGSRVQFFFLLVWPMSLEARS